MSNNSAQEASYFPQTPQTSFDALFHGRQIKTQVPINCRKFFKGNRLHASEKPLAWVERGY